MSRPRGESKDRLELSIPFPLKERTRRAAWWFGYQGERDLSEFICMVLEDWLNKEASKRKEKEFPEIPQV